MAQISVGSPALRFFLVFAAMLFGSVVSYGLLKNKIARLAQLASIDSVTGLYNAQAIQKLLRYDIERSRRYQRDLSVILLDIDDFSSIQGLHGRQQTDHVLGFLSKIILDGIEYTDKKKKEFHGIRHSDIAFRYDEEDRILIIMPETAAKGAYIAAERIREAVMFTPFPAFQKEGKPLHITLSAGVVSFDRQADTVDDLLKRVDLLLRKAKITKNHVVIENPVHRNLLDMDDSSTAVAN